MKILGVIPARYGSTRFPGKALVSLHGRPLIQWVIEAAQKSKKLTELVVATDDERILKAARAMSVTAVMTDPHLPSGTDRVFAASIGHKADIVVNIQGDEPLINPQHIDLLISAFEKSPPPQMATLAHAISIEELMSPNAVKVVRDHQGYALYFSRYAIPYSRILPDEANQLGPEFEDACLKHIGMYAYTNDFLQKFCQTKPSIIEQTESLEQLRALSMGAKIKVFKVNEASPGVDTPEDLEKVSQIISQIISSKNKGMK